MELNELINRFIDYEKSCIDTNDNVFSRGYTLLQLTGMLKIMNDNNMNIYHKIGALYVDHHDRKKQLSVLKDERNGTLQLCTDYKSGTCYGNFKMDVISYDDMCKHCKKAWAEHKQIVKIAAINGGIKNSINHLIKSL